MVGWWKHSNFEWCDFSDIYAQEILWYTMGNTITENCCCRAEALFPYTEKKYQQKNNCPMPCVVFHENPVGTGGGFSCHPTIKRLRLLWISRIYFGPSFLKGSLLSFYFSWWSWALGLMRITSVTNTIRALIMICSFLSTLYMVPIEYYSIPPCTYVFSSPHKSSSAFSNIPLTLCTNTFHII